jgi:phospholipase D1/2
MSMKESSSHREASSAPTEHRKARSGTRRLLILLPPLLPLLVAGVVWWSGGLEQIDSPESVAETARSLGDSPAGFLYVMLGFGVGSLLFVPVTALIAGTALAFGPLRGVAFSLLGVLLGASTTYWCGRLLGGRALDYFSGPRLARIKHELCTRAFRASIVARLLPVGNFTVINLLAGSLRVPFRAYFFGNLVGALPGVLVIGLFTDQLGAAIRSPNATNMTALAIGALLLVGLMFWLRRSMRKREQRAASGGAVS